MQTIKFNKLNLKEDDLLLDMGCGEGRHTIGAYIEKPVNSFGFDLSFKDLKIARDRLNDFDVSYKKEICQFGVGDIDAQDLVVKVVLFVLFFSIIRRIYLDFFKSD